MNIYHKGHESLRDLKQLGYAIFGNKSVEISSILEDETITTKIEYEMQEYVDKMHFTEKNDIKRSLYNCAFLIRDWDVPWGILTGINPSKLVPLDYNEDEFCKKYYVDKKRATFAKEVSDFREKTKTDVNDISLYVGIPFCKTKCAYCSFVGNSIDTANKHQDEYVKYLLLEIETVSKLIKNRKLKTIYVGGGTPTALSEENFEKLLSAIDTSFSKEYLEEYTVEAGRVDTITDQKLVLMKDYGVDRISINPQVFDDSVLETIGRNHTSDDVYKVYEKARKLNFKAINMDIIYGLGGDFEYTVDKLFELNPENITLHTLAIKKGSKLDISYEAKLTDINYFYNKISKNYSPYYMYRQQYLVKPYENIGFYRDNTPCMYNVYMMENLMDIIAVGSGSTSKIANESYFNNKYPVDYIKNIDKVLKTKSEILSKE